jgi:hypothetical protein
LRIPETVPASLRPFIARLVHPRRDRRFRSATQALAALDAPRVARPRPLFVAALCAAIAMAAGAVARARAVPHAAAGVAAPSFQEPAARWFHDAKPSCNPVEVAQVMARRPPPAGWKGAAYEAGCWALAGKIAEARGALDKVPSDERWRAAGVVFDLAHPVADAGDDVSAAPIMNLVLESWPNHFMALYHAGMSDYSLGNRDRARTHLTEFLRLYSTDDGFRRNAQQVLARID